MTQPAQRPYDIVAAVVLLLVCQLAGETMMLAVRHWLPGFTFPGPVVGMALFFVYLLARGGPSPDADAVSGALLRNLSLLFVPAAVGVVQYGDLLSRFGLALVVALVVSTVLTLLVTVGVFILVSRWTAHGQGDADVG